MEVTILGCHSATPREKGRPTAQVLDIRGHMMLIDCGEATQIALRQAGVKFSRIKHIFISHLHGDHFFGLFGLVSTFQLLGREAELHIYGPKGIAQAVNLLMSLGKSHMSFPIHFHELTSKSQELLFEDDKITVKTIPLKHRVYTNGFLFQEKSFERKINLEAVQRYNIDVCYYQNLKSGKDLILDDGTILPNKDLTLDPLLPQSYAFCSDTMYLPQIVPLIEGTRVLYHESTFLNKHQDLAEKTMHTTAFQAAQIAKSASVQTLILGHYSSRYSDKQQFYQEAKTVFPNTILAEDGKRFVFKN